MGFPNDDMSGFISSRNQFAIAVEGACIKHGLEIVGGEWLMFARHFADHFCVFDIPDPQCHVVCDRSEELAIGANRSLPDPFFMGIQSFNLFACRSFPPRKLAIVSTRYQGVILENQRSDIAGVRREGTNVRLGIIKIDFMDFEIRASNIGFARVWNTGDCKENILPAQILINLVTCVIHDCLD